MSSLLGYLRTQAAEDSELATLLGPTPFRWFDRNLPQNYKLFPAVVARIISNPITYGLNQRFVTSRSRVQLAIWGGKYDAGIQACDAVTDAITTFFDQFNAVGVPGLARYPNEIVNEIDGEFPMTDGPIYTRIMDVMIFSNSTKLS